MSTLYGTKVDESRWNIIEVDSSNYHSYNLVDKESLEIYYLKNIIGIEQVAEDEFLVYDKFNEDAFRIVRYRVEKTGLVKMLEAKFSCFYFITDDRILFTNWDNLGGYHSSGIYSIKDNTYVEEGKWLNGSEIELVDNDDDPDKVGLDVKETINACRLGNPKLLFSVDSETLQPDSDCYSQLRDSSIKISSREDVERIKLEDQKYARIIEENLYDQEREQLEKAKEKILSRHNEDK